MKTNSYATVAVEPEEENKNPRPPGISTNFKKRSLDIKHSPLYKLASLEVPHNDFSVSSSECLPSQDDDSPEKVNKPSSA